MTRQQQRLLRWVPRLIASIAFGWLFTPADMAPAVVAFFAFFVGLVLFLAALDVLVTRYRWHRSEQRLIRSIQLHPSGHPARHLAVVNRIA